MIGITLPKHLTQINVSRIRTVIEQVYMLVFTNLALLFRQNPRLLLFRIGIQLLIMRHHGIHVPRSLACRYIIRASGVEDPVHPVSKIVNEW